MLNQLPADVTSVFREFLTCEFTTMGRNGYPVTWPLLPIFWPEQDQFLVFSPIGLSQKAANIRRDARVALLFSEPTGSDLRNPPAALVQGEAAAPEEIITTSAQMGEALLEVCKPQIVRLLQRQPAFGLYLKNPLTRGVMDWYFMRVKIVVKPRRVTWWEQGDFARTPRCLSDGWPEQGADSLARAGPRWNSGGEGAEWNAADTGWTRTVRHLPAFSSAVLTGLDRAGHPFSLRCRPQADEARKVLRLPLAASAPLRPGPACLLCHRHDERLWALKSFVARGELEQEGEEWSLRVRQFIPGMGLGGWTSYLRFVVTGRRNTRRYLRRRGLPRPRVFWEDVAQVKSWVGKERKQ